jgi:predicted HNH restriction endonuclease
MQWDHLPGVEKLASVAELYGYSRDRVLAEIAKCELVCANCHAVRTYRRKREIVVDDGPHAYSGPTPP